MEDDDEEDERGHLVLDRRYTLIGGRLRVSGLAIGWSKRASDRDVHRSNPDARCIIVYVILVYG
jgi:hypothetical protein